MLNTNAQFNPDGTAGERRLWPGDTGSRSTRIMQGAIRFSF